MDNPTPFFHRLPLTQTEVAPTPPQAAGPTPTWHYVGAGITVLVAVLMVIEVIRERRR